MTYLPEAVRQRVRQRAGNRCEYCLGHQAYILEPGVPLSTITIKAGERMIEINLPKEHAPEFYNL